jgi:hypothetical protein
MLKVIQMNFADMKDEYIKVLPQNFQDFLAALAGENNIVIKGGVAKLCLMAMLKVEGKLKDEERWQKQQKINDIDFNFIFPPETRDLRKQFIEKYQRIKDLLSTINFQIEPKDMNIVEAKSIKDGMMKILENNDLTINEEAVALISGKWKIFYTPSAALHLANGIGVLNPKPGHIWNSAGRIFPSPLGMVRLFKFLVRGTVDKIYLPKWWLTLYFENYKKKIANNELPVGTTLSYYSLILMKNYFGTSPELQNRAMILLKDLGFTDLLDPQAYIKQQEEFLKDFSGNIEIKQLTIEDVFERFLEFKKKGDENKKKRLVSHLQCDHEFQAFECDLCGKNQCFIENCLKCDKNKNTSPPPCTLRFWMGKIEPADFYSIKQIQDSIL